MFAFAIWDRDERRLFLARDRMGIKPLYYCLRDGELIFASELKAILEHPRVDRRLNLLSVSKYFTYGYIPAPDTIFEDIHKLEPGSYLVFDRDGELARDSRQKAFDWVTREGVMVGGAHLPFPGFGTLTRAGAGFSFAPA